MTTEPDQTMINQWSQAIFRILDQELPEAPDAKTRQQDYWITLPDGTRLFTNVYSPSEPGPWPVILVRTPYVAVQMLYAAIIAPVFARYGYAVVLNQVRGALQSEGEWLPFEHEREDGRAVIDWVAGQPWCDGNIGGFGASYLGHIQWSVADYQHPMLKTLYISVCGVDAYNNFYRRGMFRQDIWTAWAAQMMADNRFKMFMFQDNFALSQAALAVRPQAELGRVLKGKACSWYERWIENTSADSPYWSSGFWKELQDSVQNIKIPLFLHGGWFDVFLRPQISSWRRLPADVRCKSRFIIGPWHHAGTPGGVLEYPGENLAGYMQIKSALEWFGHHLKGKPYPHRVGVIEAYSIRANQWKVWQDDFSAAMIQKFYFSWMGQSGGALSSQNPSAEATASFTYDPANPVPSIAGTLLGNYRDPFGQPECSTIMMAVGERSDVLSFVSDPLEQDLHIAGAMAVHLFVSSSAPATAFTIMVMEMRPDGTSVNIRDDITDIRWPDENSTKPYTAGSVVELSLSLLDVSWMLGAGSRLRVDISSSNYPAYHVHPNTEELWSKSTKLIKAVQTIYCGGDYPSRIELPVQ